MEPAYIETVPGQGYRFVAEVHDPPAAEPEPGGAKPRLSRRSLLVAASVGTPLVCLTGLAAVRLLRRPDPVARVTVGGRFLSALSATGRVLWTHKFDAPLRDFPPDEDTWRTQIVDVDGDGIPEILVVATSAREHLSTSAQLFCFSSTGKMLWQYEPTTKVEFGTPGMNGPWKFEDILVTSKNGAPSVWAAIVQAVWWPSFVVRLSPTGIAKLVFANPGNVRSLWRIETDSGPYILLAGINNGYRRAFVAMLAEDSPPSASPEAGGPAYRCVRACPSGRPHRYVLLPQSELSGATLPYSIAEKITARPGGVTVQTVELGDGDVRPSGFFFLSDDLRPEGVAYGDSYRQVHESLERRGLITHSFKDCPEQKSPAVFDVCDENGHWSRVAVPRVRAS